MNYYKLIGELVVVMAIAVIVNLIMQPKQPKYLPLSPDNAERIEILENRMDINREIYNDIKLKFDSLAKIKNTNETKIIRIRENRGANNAIISAMSSDELTRILSSRYKDSLR
jgi:hypothetical protein